MPNPPSQPKTSKAAPAGPVMRTMWLDPQLERPVFDARRGPTPQSTYVRDLSLSYAVEEMQGFAPDEVRAMADRLAFYIGPLREWTGVFDTEFGPRWNAIAHYMNSGDLREFKSPESELLHHLVAACDSAAEVVGSVGEGGLRREVHSLSDRLEAVSGLTIRIRESRSSGSSSTTYRRGSGARVSVYYPDRDTWAEVESKAASVGLSPATFLREISLGRRLRTTEGTVWAPVIAAADMALCASNSLSTAVARISTNATQIAERVRDRGYLISEEGAVSLLAFVSSTETLHAELASLAASLTDLIRSLLAPSLHTPRDGAE